MTTIQIKIVPDSRPNDDGQWIEVTGIEEANISNWSYLNSLSGRGYHCVSVSIHRDPPNPTGLAREEFDEGDVT